MKKVLGVLLMLAFALAMPTGLPAWEMALAGIAVITVVLFAPMVQNGGVFTAGISREVWENHIEENLFPNNEFLLAMMDESEYVNFKTVHSPNAGSVPTVTVDPSFPLGGGAGLNVNKRADSVVDWTIHEFMTNPWIITNAEEVELSYDKMSSVLYEIEMALRKTIAENVIIYIAPTGTALLPDGVTTNANILRSTGITNNDITDIRNTAAYTPGATGNRLNFTLYDIRQAKKLFDKQNIPFEDRAMIVSPDAVDQIVSDLIITKYRGDASDVYDTATGKVDRLLGFKFYMRSQVCQYTNAGTPVVKAFGAAGAADDNDAIIFFQKAFVARAIGDIHIFEQLNSPTQGGDIYSALIRMGATKKRASELGVGAIVQTAA